MQRNINIKFPYFCRKYEKSMEVEASIGVLDHYDTGENWHVSFSCERSNCPMARNCNRLKPKKYLKSEGDTISELMKRIKNES